MPEAGLDDIALHSQEHGYLRTPLSNNAVKGPSRGAAGLAHKKVPVLDYSI